MPNVGDLFSLLGEMIRRKFLTSLKGQNAFNDVTQELLALPVHLGGLGITNPLANTTAHHDASKKITAPLTALIVEQPHQYTNTMKAEQLRIKQESAKDKKHHQSQVAADLKDKLPNKM